MVHVFFPLIHCAFSITAFIFLLYLLKLVAFSRYFRPCQRRILTVITLLMIGIVVFSSLAVANQFSDGKKVLLKVIKATKQTYNLLLEFAEVLLYWEISSIAVVPFSHSARWYRFLFSTFIASSIIFAMLLPILSTRLAAICILLLATGNIINYWRALLAAPKLVDEANARQAPIEEIHKIEEHRTTAWLMRKFTCCRLALQFTQAVLTWTFFSPIAFLCVQVLTVLEPFFFVFILLDHKQSCRRFYTEEIARFKAFFGANYPNDLRFEFPTMSIMRPDVRMIIWKTDILGVGKVMYVEPINWNRLDDYPMERDPFGENFSQDTTVAIDALVV